MLSKKIYSFLTIVIFLQNNLYSASHPLYSNGKYIGYLLDNEIYEKHIYEGAIYKGTFRDRIIRQGNVDILCDNVLFNVTTLHSVGIILMDEYTRRCIIAYAQGCSSLYGKDIRKYLKEFIIEDMCKKQTPIYKVEKIRSSRFQELDYSIENCYCNFQMFMDMIPRPNCHLIKINELHGKLDD